MLFLNQVKTNHKHFPKRDIEQKMKDWSTGAYLVLKCKTPKGITLYAIGFKYSKDDVMSFICTENAGSTRLKELYQIKYLDEFGNRVSRDVERPDVIGKYFRDAGTIDSHNQARQGELDLEYNWPTQDCWFRLNTTFIGLNVTDTWKVVKFYTNTADTIKEFADVLALQCINNKYADSERQYIPITCPPTGRSLQHATLGIASLNMLSSVSSHIGSDEGSSVSDLSTSRLSTCTVEDLHYFTQTTQKEGTHNRTKRRACNAPGCNSKTSLECMAESCRSKTSMANRFKATGVFFCSEHIHVHHEQMKST